MGERPVAPDGDRLDPALHARVQRVAQPVADEVDAEDQQEDRDAGEEREQ